MFLLSKRVAATAATTAAPARAFWGSWGGKSGGADSASKVADAMGAPATAPVEHKPSSETADAVIIGAGIIGSSIALQLARKGVRVTVLEKNGSVGSGSTSYSSGIWLV